MATDKPRFSVTFTDETFSKIQKYRKENNISTQSKTVARLVELAINEIESKKKSPSADESVPEGFRPGGEHTHIKKYRSLDDYGKEAVDGVLDVESRRCAELKSISRPMIQATARSGDVTEVEDISSDEVSGDEIIP